MGIDINLYRQRIGNFHQPGQRKIVQKYEVKRNHGSSLSWRLLHLFFILVLSSLCGSSSISENRNQIHSELGVSCSWQLGLARNSENCSFQLRMNWVAENEVKRTLRLADSNFYARYTYGNRANRDIKLCH